MTDISLKEYVDQAFLLRDAALSEYKQTGEKRLLETRETLNQRLETLNEFRAQLTDIINTLQPRGEYQVQHKALGDKVDLLTDRLNNSDGLRKGYSSSWLILIGALTALAAVTAILINTIRLLGKGI